MKCLASLRLHPYLLEEEETYEPPEDPDSGELHSSGMTSDPMDVERRLFLGLSLEELGMRALERLPRDKAIDGIRAFNEMRFVAASIVIFYSLRRNLGLTKKICTGTSS